MEDCSKQKIMLSKRSRDNNETTSPSKNTYDNEIFSILSSARAWTSLIGNLRSNDADGNENVKKQ